MSAEAHDHHEISWWKKYVFSTDHKTIGIQYGLTAGLFLLFGFFLMIVMRWSIAYPHEPLPDYLSWMFTDGWKARWLQDGKVTGETYNMFGAMHGTIMVFLGVVPLGFAAFGNSCITIVLLPGQARQGLKYDNNLMAVSVLYLCKDVHMIWRYTTEF